MMTGEPPKMRYTPSKTIKDNWSYISVSEFDCVIGVKQTVQKIMVLLDKDNKPIRGQDGLPSFSVMTTTVVKAMSKEDWIVEKKVNGVEE